MNKRDRPNTKGPTTVRVCNDANIPSHYAHSFNVMKMAQGFAALGCDSGVVTAQSLRTLKNRRKYPDLKEHYGLSLDLNVTWLRPSWKAFLSSRTQDDPVYAGRVARYVGELNIDLVFSRSFLTPLLTVQAGIPTVVETHTTHYDNPALQNLYAVAGLPAFRTLLTIHSEIAGQHIKRGVPADKILVLEDGVDLERFAIPDDPMLWKKQLGLDPEKSYAVYAGHLYRDKGIEVILETARLLKGREELAFLLVGGLDEDRTHWESICRRKGLDNVSFTGFIPNARIPGYLKAAFCLLLPYQLDMQHTVMDIATTSPLKLFEYMAAERPIVATDIPTVSKILQEGPSALLQPPGDVAAFAAAVETLMEDGTLARRLARRARREVESFSWTERCRRVLQHARPDLIFETKFSIGKEPMI